MNGAKLLGPNARPMVGLGGSEAWKQRTIKGITCSFQWIDLSAEFDSSDDPGITANACMCLFNAQRSSQRGAYVIPQQHAFLFGSRAGHPTAHLFSSAFAAAEMLGFDMRDKSAVKAVIDIIIEGLADLVLMPSSPPNNADIIVKDAVQGIEATARINGQKIHEELL